MLFALADRSSVIRQDHLRAGLAVWGYCRESARLLFATPAQATEPDPLWLQVLNVINGSPGINRKQMYGQFSNHLKANVLDDALAYLERSGLAHSQMVQAEGGGRPAECWYPGPGPDAEPVPANDTAPSAPPGTHDPAKACELTNYLPSGDGNSPELVSSLAGSKPGDEERERAGVIRPAEPTVFDAGAFGVAAANEPTKAADDTMTEAEFFKALDDGLRANKRAS